MHSRVFAGPDDGVVSVRSSIPISGLNFAATVAVPGLGSIPFGVACGRGLAHFERVMTNELPEGFTVRDVREVTLRGGRLATAQVVIRQPNGMPPVASRWGGWESAETCVTTSRKGASHEELVSLMARTPFRRSGDRPGVVFDAPIDNRVSPVRATTFVPLFGVVEMRRRVPEVNALLPSARGARVEGGELFRVGRHSQTFLLVGDSTAVWIRPVGRAAAQVLGFASTLDIRWEAA